MILLFVIVGLILMVALLYISSRVAHENASIVRQSILRVAFIVVVMVGVFLWARYWLLLAVSCRPDCVGANLVAWDLERAVLRNSDFAEANLRGANLSNADLFNADFSGANLDGVNFQNGNLRSTRFMGAVLSNADFRGAQLGDTDLRGAQLNEADLTHVDLTRVHLDGVVFDNAKLVEANLTNKDLAGVSFVRADLTGADLSDADLRGSRLSGANLSGARLTDSNLAGAWLNLADLTGADLRGANLAGAHLMGAKLSSADLSGSQLIGASLIGAHVNGANLRSADLTGIRLLVNELLPLDILTDPLLEELNELQLLEVIADVDLSGVRFNRQTKWPVGRTSILEGMLGTRFYEYALDNVETALFIEGNSSAMLLSQAIYRQFEQNGNTQPVLLDTVTSSSAIEEFCTDTRVHLVTINRPFGADEAERCSLNGRRLITFTVGIQALVLVVNPDNDFINGVNPDQLAALTTANRWSDVNLSWPRMPINRLIPNVETVTLQFWVERLFSGNVEAARQALSAVSLANSAAQLIQAIISDPYAIGVFDYGDYQRSGSALKLLPISGQIPSKQSISHKAYMFTLPIYLYADTNQIGQLPELRNFLIYYFNHVNLVIEQVGLFPVDPELLVEAKTRLERFRILNAE
ncbi:pentapeptide repeat-containing protein [Chloroflexi bacterium TSY]|nr:pentapeptide repeat-containing protein [Chloroflexi bacterium TSY]WAB21642.1 pentapeptide repeat-containing protein [Chloroflexota bacterium]